MYSCGYNFRLPSSWKKSLVFVQTLLCMNNRIENPEPQHFFRSGSGSLFASHLLVTVPPGESWGATRQAAAENGDFLKAGANRQSKGYS